MEIKAWFHGEFQPGLWFQPGANKNKFLVYTKDISVRAEIILD